MTPPEQTLPEAETRKIIDQKLIAAGWVIQDKQRINTHESLGVAVREMDTSTGLANKNYSLNAPMKKPGAR